MSKMPIFVHFYRQFRVINVLFIENSRTCVVALTKLSIILLASSFFAENIEYVPVK